MLYKYFNGVLLRNTSAKILLNMYWDGKPLVWDDLPPDALAWSCARHQAATSSTEAVAYLVDREKVGKYTTLGGKLLPHTQSLITLGE